MSTTYDRVPRNCTFSENDWHILAGFWYPVGLSEEVGENHFATTLLDVKLVLFRNNEGKITAANNVCPHRGASLTRGWMEEGHLVCAYHGLKYNGEGKCTRIPAAGPDVKIPEKLCLKTYQAEEHYGLVWVCLKDKAVHPLPKLDVWSDPKVQKAKLNAYWNASASRHAENFMDVAHAAWIHAETFAPREYPEIGRFEVKETDYGFYYDTPTTFLASNTFEAKRNRDIETILSEYYFTLPFTSHLILKYKAGVEQIFDSVQPISSNKIRLYMLKTRDYMLDEPVDDWINFQEITNEEDRGTVEDQCPEELPLDLSEEFHIASDAFSVAYRRKLKALGLEGPMTL